MQFLYHLLKPRLSDKLITKIAFQPVVDAYIKAGITNLNEHS